MARGRLALALDGRASHQGCSVSAGVAAVGPSVASAPSPPAPVLMKVLRPSPDDRDDRSFISSSATGTPNVQLPTPSFRLPGRLSWELVSGSREFFGADGSTWNER